MKLIDKAAVVAEIEKQQRRLDILCQSNEVELHKNVAIQNGVYCSLLSFLDTLEVKQVDLKNELKEDWLFADKTEVDCLESMCLTEGMFVSLAKKYFELGLKASNPITEVNLESLVRQVIDLYLEAREYYNNVIKEERKEHGGSDLAIKLLDGVIDAKELGIQYVLDKFKAQKGEIHYDRQRKTNKD